MAVAARDEFLHADDLVRVVVGVVFEPVLVAVVHHLRLAIVPHRYGYGMGLHVLLIVLWWRYPVRIVLPWLRLWVRMRTFSSLLPVSTGLRLDEIPFVGVVRPVLFDEVEAFTPRLVLMPAATFFDYNAAVEAGPTHGCGWVWARK